MRASLNTFVGCRTLTTRWPFGLTDLGHIQKRSAEAATSWDLSEAVDALSVPVSAVERAIEAGRIRPQDPGGAATQILSASHGFVLLAMSGLIDPQGAHDVMASVAINSMWVSATRAVR